jgi:hypothetical protein
MCVAILAETLTHQPPSDGNQSPGEGVGVLLAAVKRSR